jgi:hypothetical protein
MSSNFIKIMITKGLPARIDAKPGKEAEVEGNFLKTPFRWLKMKSLPLTGLHSKSAKKLLREEKAHRGLLFYSNINHKSP